MPKDCRITNNLDNSAGVTEDFLTTKVYLIIQTLLPITFLEKICGGTAINTTAKYHRYRCKSWLYTTSVFSITNALMQMFLNMTYELNSCLIAIEIVVSSLQKTLSSVVTKLLFLVMLLSTS
jgi:hypothetical protein